MLELFTSDIIIDENKTSITMGPAIRCIQLDWRRVSRGHAVAAADDESENEKITTEIKG